MSVRKKERRKLRIDTSLGICGYAEHMTIDELRERVVGEDFDATCPRCGMFHLTREEIEELNKEKLVDSQKFVDVCKEAKGK